MTKKNTLVEIAIHSSVSLITNSSTEIFTDERATELACKEMVEEYRKAFGIEESFDSMFHCGVMLSTDRISEVLEWQEEDPSVFGLTLDEWDAIVVDEVVEDVVSGKIEKPDWLKKVEQIAFEESDNNYNYEGYSTCSFYLVAKDEKWQGLAESMKKFLHSPTSYATYC